jgi:hypothetical protein
LPQEEQPRTQYAHLAQGKRLISGTFGAKSMSECLECANDLSPMAFRHDMGEQELSFDIGLGQLNFGLDVQKYSQLLSLPQHYAI